MADRLSKIADVVERESAQGVKLSTAGEKAGPKKFGVEIESLRRVSKFPLIVSKQLSGDLAKGAIPVSYQEKVKDVLLQDVKVKTSGLAGYGRDLRALSRKFTAGASPNALTALEAGSVPLDAAIVISAGAPSLSTPAAAQPFGVVLPIASDAPIYEFIVGLGVATVDYPSTAAILYRTDPSGPLLIGCTGTLIAPNAVLTAGHCVKNANLPAPAAVFFQHAGIHSVASSIVHPTFAFPSADLAIVFLKDSVTGIQPLALNQVARISPGTSARIIGYGYHSGLADVPGAIATVVPQAGMKFSGTVTTGACEAESIGKGLICWTYQAGNLESLAASTCHGDSGGPLIVWSNGGWLLAGVTSGGQTCLPGDKPFDTEVFDYAAWIKDAVNAVPLGDAAGPIVASALVPVIDNRQRFAMPAPARIFGPQDVSWTRTFSVAPGTRLLRVAMNTSGFGGTMHFVVGPTGAGTAYDAKTDDMAAACEIPDPQAGEWQVSLSGLPSQEYQIVATTF
ncbi:MAG: trypsin-like serine protease [Dokdonella sp.]